MKNLHSFNVAVSFQKIYKLTEALKLGFNRMDTRYEKKYHDELEIINWWFKSRQNLIIDLLANTDRKAKILDVGCSGGGLIKKLKEKNFRNIYGIDVSERAIEVCKKKGIKRIFLMDASSTEFKKNTFDVLIASDILEHIKDEKNTLKEWNRILKYGGVLIIFVPAFQFLFGPHDEANHHYRRYSRKRLNVLLQNNNFIIKRSSYWNFLLFIPCFFLKLATKLIFQSEKKDNFYKIPSWLNKLFFNILMLENRFIIKGGKFFFGVSVLSVCYKD